MVARSAKRIYERTPSVGVAIEGEVLTVSIFSFMASSGERPAATSFGIIAYLKVLTRYGLGTR